MRDLNSEDRPLLRRGLYANTYKGQDIFCSAHAGNDAFRSIGKGVDEPSVRTFAAYLKISDQLIEEASKEDIGEVARVLALHLAHYQNKYDAIPVEESLRLILTETIDDDQAKALAFEPARFPL